MNQSEITKLAFAGAILFAAYKFGPPMVKAGAIAVGAGVIAKRIPYLNEVV